MTTPVADPIPVAIGRDVDFVSAHADDERLMKGWVIAHHVLAQRPVHLILATDGSTTSALGMLNGEAASGWWGGYHNPEREGYQPLTPQDISDARDREYISSGRQFGLPLERIHLNKEHRGPDLNVDQATALLLRRREQSPDAGVYTHHWDDIDDSHAALGEALLELHLASPLDWPDVRWMVRPEQVGTTAGATQYGIPGQYADDARLLMTRGTRCYAAWAPSQGRYAVGYHSVGLSLFAKIMERPNYFVKP